MSLCSFLPFSSHRKGRNLVQQCTKLELLGLRAFKELPCHPLRAMWSLLFENDFFAVFPPSNASTADTISANPHLPAEDLG